MGIVVSSSYALSAAAAEDGWKPVILWNNLATVGNITTTAAEANYPATNLANVATNLIWKQGNTSDGYITCLFGSERDVDAVGIARHNLGSGLCPMTVQGLPSGGDPDAPGDWLEIVAQQQLADDSPALFRFTVTPLIGIRLKLEPTSTAPQAAVFSTGKLLVLAKGIPPGHTPISYGEDVNFFGPRSQSGEFLGRVVLSSALSSSIVQQYLDPDWYRENLEPFRAASKTSFFFWAWSPESHPAEVGYCQVTNNPKPVINQTTGHIDINFDIAGLAL